MSHNVQRVSRYETFIRSFCLQLTKYEPRYSEPLLPVTLKSHWVPQIDLELLHHFLLSWMILNCLELQKRSRRSELSINLRGLSFRKRSKSFALQTFTKKWEWSEVLLPLRSSHVGIYQISKQFGSKWPNWKTNFTSEFCEVIARKGMNFFATLWLKDPHV